MTIKLEALRCLVTVARHGNLAGAADALGRTPAAISMMLSQLEQHIGAPLFESDRKSRLTPLGLMTLEEAERAVAIYEQSVAAIDRHSRSTAGTVRIAAVPSVSMTLQPRAIARYRETRPHVRLEISDVDSAAVFRRLEMGAADIGLASGTVPPSLEAIELATDPLGIICHAEGPIASAAGPANWSSLALETFIDNGLCMLVEEPDVQDMLKASPLTALNTTTLLSFVRAGFGATILPERALPPERGPLRYIQPEGNVYQRRVLLLQRRDGRVSPAALAFKELLIAMARDEKVF
ncbi:LysR family transcriptional regulator [Roseovarius sp.]|uniref:LysR family transcriptional regulator n=1 Tax=Roseovarius sp. TaxID=1486281 RepID=UPI00356501C6